MIHATEIKSVQIPVNKPSPPNPPPPVAPISLATTVSAALKISFPGVATVSVSVTPIGTDPNPMNHYCLLHTGPSTFPIPGAYTVQLVLTQANGDTPRCDETVWTIGPSL
jgi:hypothetical protein